MNKKTQEEVAARIERIRFTYPSQPNICIEPYLQAHAIVGQLMKHCEHKLLPKKRPPHVWLLKKLDLEAVFQAYTKATSITALVGNSDNTNGWCELRIMFDVGNHTIYDIIIEIQSWGHIKSVEAFAS